MPRLRSLFVRLAIVAAAAASVTIAAADQTATAVRTAIRLADASADSGLTATNAAGDRAKDYIVEANGNGAALFDYDGDGDLDVLLVTGSTRDHIKSGGDAMVALYRNDGHARFTDVTTASGLTRTGWGVGTCVADVDNDGFDDVYVTGFGANVLWHNTGKGTFVDVTKRAGVADTRWSTGCAFNDYDHDGHVDLYVANYVKFDAALIPARGATTNCRFMATDVFCGPSRLPGESDVLYRNNGDGTFTDVTARAGVVDPGYYGFGVVFADLTGDGWPDIYVANDSVPHLFFRNRGDGTFVEEGLQAGVALSGDGRPQAGMGVDVGDYNGDGLPDLVVTNFSHDYNTLYENGPPGLFTDKSYAAGVAATAGPFLGWGVQFVDLDNDGRLDLLIANGHVYPQVDQRGLGTAYRQRKLVLQNDGRRFRNVSADVAGGILLERSSRGAAFGDVDNDGDVDAVIVNMDDRPTLLRNDTVTGNHWVTVRLIGRRSNRGALGARVTVTAGGRKQSTEVRGDGSYLSHSDTRAHFGLGTAARVSSIDIRWPSGLVEHLAAVAADRFYVAEEGTGIRGVSESSGRAASAGER